ncbi:hypothetical protein [Aeromonas sp. QDB22]|nr:hypothetical protein [Aeromonas sp. QDB22]
MIVRLEPITASVVAVMGWAWNTATAAPLRRGAAASQVSLASWRCQR